MKKSCRSVVVSPILDGETNYQKAGIMYPNSHRWHKWKGNSNPSLTDSKPMHPM